MQGEEILRSELKVGRRNTAGNSKGKETERNGWKGDDEIQGTWFEIRQN